MVSMVPIIQLVMTHLPENLQYITRAIIDRTGMTQKELGKRAGVSQSQISRITRGQRHKTTYEAARTLLNIYKNTVQFTR